MSTTNQDSTVYNPTQQGTYSPFPLSSVSQPSYSSQQHPALRQYPSQPYVYDQYSGHPTVYEQYSSQSANKQTPPYVDPNAAVSYEQNQMSLQPPPVVPNVQFPKDEEQAGEWGNFSSFDNKEIRRAFIRKVYVVLMAQLLVTFGIIALFRFTKSVRDYIRSPSGQWAYWTSYAVFLVTYLALACCKTVGRRFPINLVLLSLLTLSMAYMMGMISAYYELESIFLAVGITTFVCLGVTLFSFQTKYDFTSCFGVLFAISLALLGFGFACIFTYSNIIYTIYAGLGAVAFSIFLAVDTQLIIGGKRHEISAEDHIFASIMLYLDVVYIFMYILILVGKRE